MAARMCLPDYRFSAKGESNHVQDRRDALSTTRVLIADNHALFRYGLKAMLASENLEMLGEASTGEEAVQLAAELRPEVI